MTRRERKLLKGFAKRAAQRRPVLVDACGEAEADVILAEARREFETLVPEVAAIEGGLMNGALKGTYEYLAYAKAMKAAGWSTERIGEHFAEALRHLAARYPSWLPRTVYRAVRPILARMLRREAVASQQTSDPAGWRFEFVEGEPGGADFGMDVKNCAVCHLFARHDQSDVVPYLCALDDELSKVLGMGLRRTGTRAVGASCCDFRYQTGGEPKTLRSQHSLPIVK